MRAGAATAGCDFILLNNRIIEELSANWAPVDNALKDATCPDVARVDEDAFHAALERSPAGEELGLGLSACAAADERLREYIAKCVNVNACA